MELGHQFGTDHGDEFMEDRRCPRYKLAINACVYPRNSPVIRGQTVDISQSGISILLRDEVVIGEVVRLEFALPLGDVDVHAVARQRSAFRYGFEFVDPIRRTMSSAERADSWRLSRRLLPIFIDSLSLEAEQFWPVPCHCLGGRRRPPLQMVCITALPRLRLR